MRTPQRLIDLATPGKRPPPAREDRPLLTMTEAARRLGIGLASLKARIADGTIDAIPVGTSGKHYRIPAAEIEKFRRGGYGPGTRLTLLR